MLSDKHLHILENGVAVANRSCSCPCHLIMIRATSVSHCEDYLPVHIVLETDISFIHFVKGEAIPVTGRAGP
jgi:hypothetical protein